MILGLRLYPFPECRIDKCIEMWMEGVGEGRQESARVTISSRSYDLHRPTAKVANFPPQQAIPNE